jgi:beta-xylosidase
VAVPFKSLYSIVVNIGEIMMNTKSDPLRYGCHGGWYKYEGNPLVGPEGGFTFDPCVVRLDGRFRMYLSLIVPGEDFTSIAFSESKDGMTEWSDITVVMKPREDKVYEDDINRAVVMIEDGLFKMWFTAQSNGGFVAADFADKYAHSTVEGPCKGVICYATSKDGIDWDVMDEPIMQADKEWEKNSVVGPCVYHDKEVNKYRMWYSGGGWAEPDALGYAESEDGVHWTKHPGNPILLPDPARTFEARRLAGPEIVKQDGWFYMFYIGFEELFKAAICIARSQNGIDGWERFAGNPVIRSGLPESFDYGCTYKASLYFDEDEDRWLLYYNGSNGPVERIGLAIHPGRELW